MINFLEKHNKISITITILLALFIFYMSSLPGEKISAGIGIPILSWETIVYHFVIFSALCFSVNISIVRGRSNRKLFIPLAIVVTIIYGASDELHQLFVPGRFCGIVDVLTDSFGALSAGIIYYLRLKFIHVRI